MKGRLLLGLLGIATLLLIMYYKLVKLHPELLSGYITMIAVIITHIMNSAEDILAALFKVGETPVAPALVKQVVPVATIQPIAAITKAS